MGKVKTKTETVKKKMSNVCIILIRFCHAVIRNQLFHVLQTLLVRSGGEALKYHVMVAEV